MVAATLRAVSFSFRVVYTYTSSSSEESECEACMAEPPPIFARAWKVLALRFLRVLPVLATRSAPTVPCEPTPEGRVLVLGCFVLCFARGRAFAWVRLDLCTEVFRPGSFLAGTATLLVVWWRAVP